MSKSFISGGHRETTDSEPGSEADDNQQPSDKAAVPIRVQPGQVRPEL